MEGRGNNRNGTLGQRLAFTFDSFLAQSSIHGLAYLPFRQRPKGYLLQAAFWTCAISVAFTLALVLINQTFRETEDFPTITTVVSVPIKEVPFPAITFDSGKTINPWGLVETLYGFVDYECYNSPFECPADKEAPLEDMRFLIEAVAAKFFHLAVKRLLSQELSLPTYSDLQDRTDTFPEFERAVATLSLVLEKNSGVERHVREKLAKVTASTFAKFRLGPINKMKGWGTEFLLPVVEAAAGPYNLSSDTMSRALKDVQGCKRNKSSCSGPMKKAYATMLLPILFNHVSHKDINLGQFVSFFSGRFIPWDFLSEGPLWGLEEQLADFLNRMADNLGLDMTTYEMSKLLDGSFTGELSGFPAANALGCHDTYRYWDKWQVYFNRNRTSSRQPPCTVQTLNASSTALTNCCLLTGSWKHQHHMILEFMKYSLQPPHFRQRQDEALRDLSLAKKAFKSYHLKAEGPEWNINPRVFSCYLLGNPMTLDEATKCQLFSRSYTNTGFGYSYNMGSFWRNHFRSNNYNKVFFDIMYPQLHMNDNKIQYFKSVGSKSGLAVSVQTSSHYTEKSQRQSKAYNNIYKEQAKVKVAIHDPNSPADFRWVGLEVEPGFLTTFLITPSQVKTSLPVKKLDPQRRGCRFKDETDGLGIFSQYTKEGCEFECMLAEALRECHCIPWNYPRFNLSLDVCDFFGAYCFEKVLADISVVDNCDCLNDCNANTYTYSKSVQKLDPEKWCHSNAEFMGFFGPKVSGYPMFMRHYDHLVHRDEHTSHHDICLEILGELAFVEFQLASPKVLQFRTDLRVTLADQIANLGGTLGLFTGMSILSFCEMLFWTLRALIGCLAMPINPKKH